MEINVYEPPRGELGARPVESAQKLYSPGQMAWATFLGAPIAGCLLLSANFRVLAKEKARVYALVSGVVSTAVLFGVAWVVPKNFPNYVIPVASLVTMRSVATSTQGEAYAQHLKAGGARQSNWKVFGVGLACFIAMLLLFVGAALLGD